MDELTFIQEWFLDHGVTILLIIGLSFVAYIILGFVIRYISRRVKSLDEVDGSDLDKRTETISGILHSTGLVVIFATAFVMALQELGIPIAPLLASVGVVGLALGLGAQTLVKDIISGLFILFENQYTVDEVVDLNGIVGTVEDMTLRATVVRDISGALHIIPNGEIRIVANRTRDWSRAIVDVSITYDSDVDRASEVLQAIGDMAMEDEEMGPLLLERPFVTGIEGLEDWAVRLRLMVKTQPNQQWGVQRYLRRAVRLKFAEEGIDLAFPRQEITLLSMDANQG